MTNQDTSATLSYLIPTGEKPIYIASRGGADAALSIGAEFEEHEVAIHDARDREVPASLDREGFTLRTHRTAIDDFYQLESSQAQYEAEITDLVLAASGGTAVFIFDHTLRSDSAAVRGQQATREPASVIHNDYTDKSARKRLGDLLDPEIESRHPR